RDRSLVDLDAGQDAAPRQHLGEWRAVVAVLTQRFLEQNPPREELLCAGRCEQQGSILAPRLVGGFDPDRLEALGDRGEASVTATGALAGRPRLGDRRLKLGTCAHGSLLVRAVALKS